ncbi:hypothetical protein N9S84_00235 [Nitrosomonadales bacterium]|jgi:hypothetical protein|nr:hypothetical protein [Nitrosomonadales bacterium]
MTPRTTSTFILLLFMLLIATSSQATCTRNAAGAIIVDADNSTMVTSTSGTVDQCSEIPDNYLIKFFKVGICTTDPINAAGEDPDLSSCSFFLNNTDGIDHVIRMPNEGALPTGDFDIPPGTYTHMVGIMSNRFGINHTETFSEALRGLTSSGTTCWSIADKVTAYTNETVNNTTNTHDTVATDNAPDTNTLECGSASDANPGFSYEVINVFSNACSSWDGYWDSGEGRTMSNGTAEAKLLQSDNSAATACTNATKMLWVVQWTSPKTVTKTSQFGLEFKLTDSVSVDLGTDNTTGYAVKMGADPVTSILTVTEPSQ